MQIIASALVVAVLVLSLRVIWDFVLADLLSVLDYLNSARESQKTYMVFTPGDVRRVRKEIHSEGGEING